jgi:hypothetical protein
MTAMMDKPTYEPEFPEWIELIEDVANGKGGTVRVWGECMADTLDTVTQLLLNVDGQDCVGV